MTADQIKIKLISRRRCFYRGESARLTFQIFNFTPVNLCDGHVELNLPGVLSQSQPLPRLAATGSQLTFDVDTSALDSGEYLFTLTFRGHGLASTGNVAVGIVPPKDSTAMLLWHWPSTVHYQALEASPETRNRELQVLHRMGITCAQLRANWALQHPAEAVEVIEAAMRLGIRMGILIENGNGGLFRAPDGTPDSERRLDADGQLSPLLNPRSHVLAERSRQLVRQLLQLFGEFPSCDTLFMNSEVEDRLKLPCAPADREHHAARLGFPLERLRSVERVYVNSFAEASGIIPDDDPDLLYFRYYYGEGDGWVPLNRLMSETARALRPDLLTIADPFRLAPIPGRLAGLGAASSWTYTNPDPKTTLFVESLASAARWNRQELLPTITHWNYAGTLVPCGTDRFAREFTLRMGPDRWTECAWINFARAPVAIGNYLGSPIEAYYDDEGDPDIYSPATATAMQNFSRHILDRFGSLTRATTMVPRRCAILDSCAARVFGSVPRMHTHYQNYQIYNFYAVMAMAQLDADVLFDEQVLDGQLDGYDLLAIAATDSLSRSVYEQIVAFARRGGIVLTDQYCQLDFPAARRVNFDFLYRKKVNANALAQGRDFAVRDDTNFRTEWDKEDIAGIPADEDQRRMEGYARTLRQLLDGHISRPLDCDSLTTLNTLRRGGRLRYLYAVNDRRTFDERSGRYGAILEKGVENPVTYTLPADAAPAHAFDMASQQTLPLARQPDGSASFAVTLPAGGGTIIALHDILPAPPHIALHSSTTAWELAITLPGSAETCKAVDVRLEYASGKAADGSRVYTLRDGTLQLSFPRAVHGPDLPARVIVTDLTSGLSAKWSA